VPNPADAPALPKPTGNSSVALPPLRPSATSMTTLDAGRQTATRPTHHTRSNSQSLMASGIQCCGSTVVSGTFDSVALRSTDTSRWLPSIFSTMPKSGTTASSSTMGHHRRTTSSSLSTRALAYPHREPDRRIGATPSRLDHQLWTDVAL
jgi:hypothetical protein